MTSLFSISSQMSQIQLVISLHSDSPKPRVVAAGVPILIPLVTNGTPAATTRGFGESECKDITNWICDICDDIENNEVINEVRAKVEELCSRFPVYK